MVMFRVQYCGVNDGFWIQERSRHFFSDPRPRWGRYVLAPRDPGDPEPGASAPDLRLRDPRSGRFASPSRRARTGDGGHAAGSGRQARAGPCTPDLRHP